MAQPAPPPPHEIRSPRGTRPRIKSRHRGLYYREDAQGRRRWIVWYEDSDGNGHFETLPLGANERDALARQAELRGRRARGARVAPPTKVTFKDFAEAWLAEESTRLRPKTVEIYRWALETHLYPKFRRRRLAEITVDDVAQLVSELHGKGLAGKSISGVLTPLSRVMQRAVRRQLVSENPVAGLERTERPKGAERKMRILSSEEIEKLLLFTGDTYRPFLKTALFTGMRLGELLELRWGQVDFEAGVVRVLEGKTNAAAREIVLMPSLARVLKRHKIASQFSKETDYVFATDTGKPAHRRTVVRNGLEASLRRAKIDHLRFHDLRHTFASILIAQGLDVVFVSDQLGHSDPAVTLRVYAKMFDPKDRRQEARERLEAAFGGMV